MKKVVRAVMIVVITVIAAAFAGCSVFNVFSVDSLIKAPRLTGENAEIQKAFESAVGKDAVLVRPVSGEYRSAYVLRDYDGDGENEAIVFYTPKDTAGEVRMHFLEYNGDEKEWQTIADVKGNGSDVHSIAFCNFDRDSVSEIVVAWAFADGQKDKMLTVYRYEKNDTDENDFVGLASVRISDYNCMDIDFDGAQELVYTIIDAASEKPAAQLRALKFDIASKRFVPLSEVQLDGRIISFINYSHDLKAGNYRFYIDSALPDDKRMTEIVIYDYSRSAFVRPVDSNGFSLGSATVRQSQDIAEDINGDGIIEVPLTEPYPKSEILSPQEGKDNIVYVTEYFRLNGEALGSVGKYYVCSELNLRIKIEKYLEAAFIRVDNAAKSIMFYSYPAESNQTGKLLFTVSEKKTDEYTAPSSSEKGTAEAVAVTVTQEGQSLGITAESVLADIQPINTGRTQ